jgi:hypothetical protein
VFTQKVIHTMLRSMEYREGDVHLTQLAAVAGHPYSDAIWRAAIRFLASEPELRARVRSVTYEGSYQAYMSRAGAVPHGLEQVLPPNVAELFRLSGEAPALGDERGWWLGELSVPVRLLEFPRSAQAGF